MKTIRPYLCLTIALALAALLAAPTIARGHDETPPDVPDDQLAAYIGAVKATVRYASADAMRAETILANVERWQTELGLSIELRAVNFLDVSEGRSVSVGDVEYEVELDWIENSEAQIEVPVYVLTRRTPSSEDPKKMEEKVWRVPTEQLRELDFSYVRNVVVMHPLHNVLPRHAAREVQLAEVLSVLTEMAGCDHAINHSLAGEIHVTFDFRNRRISECLELAAEVAGWQVEYLEYGAAGGPAIFDESDSWIDFGGGEPRNGRVDSDDVAGMWAAREYHNARNPDQPIDTLQDALELALRNAARSVKAQRAVVAMVPND